MVSENEEYAFVSRWALFISLCISLDEPVLSLSDVRLPLAPPVPEPVFGNNPFGPQAL